MPTALYKEVPLGDGISRVNEPGLVVMVRTTREMPTTLYKEVPLGDGISRVNEP